MHKVINIMQENFFRKDDRIYELSQEWKIIKLFIFFFFR